jgi:hypothetical protein
MKCKIFVIDNSHEYLLVQYTENKINTWLKDNPNITIINQSSCSVFYSVIITIMYKD